MTTLKKTPPNTWSSRVHDMMHPNEYIFTVVIEAIPTWNMPSISTVTNPYNKYGQIVRKIQYVYNQIKQQTPILVGEDHFNRNIMLRKINDSIKDIMDNRLSESGGLTGYHNETRYNNNDLNELNVLLNSYLDAWSTGADKYMDTLSDRPKNLVDTAYENVSKPIIAKVQSILSRPRLPTVRPPVLTEAEEQEIAQKLSQLEFEKRNHYQAELLNAENHLNSRSTVTNLNYMPHLRSLHRNDKLGLDKTLQADLDKRSPPIGRPQSNSDNPLDPLSSYSAKSIITQSNINTNQISKIFLEITPVLIELCYVNSMIANHYTGTLRDINNDVITLVNINKVVNKFKKDFKEKASQIYKLKDIYATVNKVQWKIPFDGQNYNNLYTNSTELLKLNTLSDIDKESCEFVINTLDDLKSEREKIVFPMFNIKKNYDVSKKNISILIEKLTSAMELDKRISIYDIIDKIKPIFIAESTRVNHPKYGNHGCDMGFCVRNLNAVSVDRRTVNALFYIPYNDNISKHLWIDDFAVENFIDDNGIIIPRMRDYYNVGYLLNDKELHQLGNDIEFHQSGGKSRKSRKSRKSNKSRKSRK